MISAKVDLRKFEQVLGALGRGVEIVAAQTATGLAFDTRDAERKHVEKIFDFASPNTKRFLGGAGEKGRGNFRVKGAKPGELRDSIRATIEAKQKSVPILRDHLANTNTTIAPGKGAERLRVRSSVNVRGDTVSLGGPKLAVPLRGQRKGRPRGKVLAKERPVRVLNRGKRAKEPGFLSKNKRAIYVRQEDDTVVAKYALISKAKLPGDFEYIRVFRDTVRKNATRQFLKNWRRQVAGGFRSKTRDFSGGGDAIL